MERISLDDIFDDEVAEDVEQNDETVDEDDTTSACPRFHYPDVRALRAIGDLGINQGLNQVRTPETPLTPDQHRIWSELYDEFFQWLLEYCRRELHGFTGANYDPLSDGYEAATDALFKARRLFAEGKINPSTPAALGAAIKTIAYRTVVDKIRARSIRQPLIDKETGQPVIDEDTGKPIIRLRRRELTSDSYEKWVPYLDDGYNRAELDIIVDSGPISSDVLRLLDTARDIEPSFRSLDDHTLLAVLSGKTVKSLPDDPDGVQERNRNRVVRSLRQRFEYQVTPRSRDVTKMTRQGTVAQKTRTCPGCGLVFEGAGRGRYCTPKCRKRASRSRKAV